MSVPFVRYLNASTALLATAALIVVTTGCGEQEQGHAPEGESHVGEPSATAIMTAHKHDNHNETCFMCDPSKREKGRLKVPVSKTGVAFCVTVGSNPTLSVFSTGLTS